jgi:hypothetical protein
MKYWNFKNPQLTGEISRELAKAATSTNTSDQTALPFFRALALHKAAPFLFGALNRITTMQPCMGVSNRLSQVRGSSPTGDTSAAILLSPVGRQVKCFASNAIPPIVGCKPSGTIPADLFSKLTAKGSTAGEQVQLIHTAIRVAGQQQMESIAKVASAGADQRTLVIHLLWLDEGQQHLFSTLAVLNARPQVNLSLLFTGQVSL